MISLFHCLGMLGLCNLPPLLSCLPLPLTAGTQPGRRSSSVLHLPTTAVPKVSSQMTLALSACVIRAHTVCCAVLREPPGEHCNHCLGVKMLLIQLDLAGFDSHTLGNLWIRCRVSPNFQLEKKYSCLRVSEKRDALIFQVKMKQDFFCLSLEGLGQRGETGGPSRVGRSHSGTSVSTANMAWGGSWGLSRAQSQQRWQCEVPRKETEVESSRRWGNHQKDPKPGSKLSSCQWYANPCSSIAV